MKYSSKGRQVMSNNNQDTVLNKAATRIQASFRGYNVRKQMKNKLTKTTGKLQKENSTKSLRKKSTSSSNGEKTEKPVDEVLEKSATKIQAGVRGFLVRRKQKKQNQ